jgi:hypothetical protein
MQSAALVSSDRRRSQKALIRVLIGWAVPESSGRWPPAPRSYEITDFGLGKAGSQPAAGDLIASIPFTRLLHHFL